MMTGSDISLVDAGLAFGHGAITGATASMQNQFPIAIFLNHKQLTMILESNAVSGYYIDIGTFGIVPGSLLL